MKRTTIIFSVLMLVSLFVIIGCKKTELPPAESNAAVTAGAEQTNCPVMDGAINKDIFVEYQGKKVYFCCPGCVDQFNKEPEKYLSKLPQFND